MADQFNVLDHGPVPETLADAKGDLLAATAADTIARLAVGSEGQALTTDPNAATGMSWRAPWHLVTTGEEVLPRHGVTTSAGLVSGTVHLGYLRARRTATVTQLRTGVDGTGSSGLTLARMGVYSVDGSGDLTLAGQTASDTTLWNSTFTAYTKSLAASFQTTAGVAYAFAVLAVGTGMPTLRGVQLSDYDAAYAPRLSGKLTGQSDLPASIPAGSVGGEDRVFQGYLL